MEKLSCLIISEDFKLSQWLRHQLEEMGHSVADLAPTSEEGIFRETRLQLDLALIDMQWDTWQGSIDVARKIRKRCRLPVIYTVSKATRELLRHARSTCPLGYLNKPVRSADLLTVMEIALNHSARTRERYHESDQPLVREANPDWFPKEEPGGDLAVARAQKEKLLSQALDYLSIGVLAVDADLSVQFSNFTGKRILRDGSLLQQRQGKLCCSNAEWFSRMPAMIRQGGNLILERDNCAPMQLRVCPASSATEHSSAILYLFDRALCSVEAEPLLREIYGLSPAEARVAAGLLENPDLCGVAERLFISRATVRTHLKRIFLKTGTHSQSSLLHSILTGPAGGVLRSHVIGGSGKHPL